MKHARRIHPADLMNPDGLSEMVMAGGVVVIVALVLALLRALFLFEAAL
jgi:hypothetical protein